MQCVRNGQVCLDDGQRGRVGLCVMRCGQVPGVDGSQQRGELRGMQRRQVFDGKRRILIYRMSRLRRRQVLGNRCLYLYFMPYELECACRQCHLHGMCMQYRIRWALRWTMRSCYSSDGSETKDRNGARVCVRVCFVVAVELEQEQKRTYHVFPLRFFPP
jgi:hypothetical protein